MKTYEKSINKRRVKTELLNSIPSSFHSNSLVLLGPNWDIALEEVKDISPLPFTITSYEVDLDVYMSQKVGLLSNQNINVNYGSVINASPKCYIDLDLTATILTQGSIIRSLLSKQLLVFPTKEKVFTFTVSTRLAGGLGVSSRGLTVYNTVFPFLEDVLKIKFTHLSHEKNKRGNWEYFFTINNPRFNIRVLSYRDGGTMLTVLIQYV